MKIARVHIENFRSIKQLDFSPGNYCALIGENNAGKSNVLKAINLVLGESWPTDRSISEEDFHGYDTSKDIVIQVFFYEIIGMLMVHKKHCLGTVANIKICEVYK